MADAFTSTGSVTLDQTAFNLAVDYALRSELLFAQIADVRAPNQSMPGSAVTFTIMNDLTAATTPLSETTDVDAVALSNTQVTITLQEFGNAVLTTAKLRGTSFVPMDPIVANIVARNAALSLDTIAATQLYGGTNVQYTSTATSRVTVGAAMVITANDIRKAKAKLRGRSADTLGGTFVGFIHPDVSYDLMGSTGEQGWLQPANYSDAQRRWNGEIGMFESIRWVETPNATMVADAGVGGTVDVYETLVVGRQALAKAYAYTDVWRENPVVEPGPVTDKLRRFQPMGWKWLGAFGRYREASIQRIESSSSLGANT